MFNGEMEGGVGHSFFISASLTTFLSHDFGGRIARTLAVHTRIEYFKHLCLVVHCLDKLRVLGLKKCSQSGAVFLDRQVRPGDQSTPKSMLRQQTRQLQETPRPKLLVGLSQEGLCSELVVGQDSDQAVEGMILPVFLPGARIDRRGLP